MSPGWTRCAKDNHFRCNRNKITEMPALWAYARRVFQTPGFGDTTDFDGEDHVSACARPAP